MEIEIKKIIKTNRVKSVEFHKTQPYLLVSLYTGKVVIYSTIDYTIFKEIEVSEKAIRTAKWIERKQWIVCGDDGGNIYIFNYNTLERIKKIKAHSDFIRTIGIHPNKSLIISGGDDGFIKQWNWEKEFELESENKQHQTYIMAIKCREEVIISASQDKTVKIIKEENVLNTLRHDKGLNCVSFLGSKILTGCDDQKAYLWENSNLLFTFENFSSVINAVDFWGSELIVIGSEKGEISIFQDFYKIEEISDIGLGRCWGCDTYENELVIAFDEGFLILKLKRDPVCSMNKNSIIFTKGGKRIFNKKIKSSSTLTDSLIKSSNSRELGFIEMYPYWMKHSPNGRFVTVIGNGLYGIYTSIAWRSHIFGEATGFCWGSNNQYAILLNDVIQIYKKFKLINEIILDFVPIKIFGGKLLGISSKNFILFFEWNESNTIIKKIDANIINLWWNSDNELVLSTTNGMFFISTEWEILSKFSFKPKTGIFIKKGFLFIENGYSLKIILSNKKEINLTVFKSPLSIIGYYNENLYLVDKEINIIKYFIPIDLIEFECLVISGDLEKAKKINISNDLIADNIANFLNDLGYFEWALEIVIDSNLKFSIAINQDLIDIAEKEAKTINQYEILIKKSLNLGNFDLAERLMWKINDFEGLLFLFSIQSKSKKLLKLSKISEDNLKLNISFTCLFLLGDIKECINLLKRNGFIAEACIMQKSYLKEQNLELLENWKNLINLN